MVWSEVREDRSLLLGLKRGDKESLRLIYNLYKDTLLTIAVSLVHDVYAGEDILHDIFVSLAENSGNLHVRGSLRNYLIASVVNRVRDKFRKNRLQQVDLKECDRISPNLNDPASSIVLDEESQLLRGALRQLPMEQREILVLHLNSGLKFREIARIQGVPVGTIQARYRYGLDKMRALLDGEKDK